MKGYTNQWIIERVLVISTIFFCITACNHHKNVRTDIISEFVIHEKDLIPEGLAFDKRSNIIYVGSTHKRKIIQIDQFGNVSDFIPSELDDLWSPIGMEVDEERDMLWVNMAHANEVLPLMHPDTTRDWMTGVAVFKIGNKKLIESYILDSAGFFNDLTIAKNGDVYITDSRNNSIYKISKKQNELEVFLKPDGFSFLNGITFNDSLNMLFVTSTQGIINVDIWTKKYFSLKASENMNTGKIDGLAFHDHYLIGHQSSKISKFYLNDRATEITKIEILDSGDLFDSSTTGEVGNGYYAYIVNSQISSGVDYEKRKIKPVDSLHNIIIRKVKLN